MRTSTMWSLATLKYLCNAPTLLNAFCRWPRMEEFGYDVEPPMHACNKAEIFQSRAHWLAMTLDFYEYYLKLVMLI